MCQLVSAVKKVCSMSKIFKGVTLYKIDLLLLICLNSCLNLKSLILQCQGNRCLKTMNGRKTKQKKLF